MKKICLLFLLYCNIDVLRCSCCDKSNDSVVKKKTKWEFLETYSTQQKRTDAWNHVLLTAGKDDNVAVPVVIEQHDKKKGCGLCGEDEMLMFAFSKNDNVKTTYDYIFQAFKLKRLVIYFNGDTNRAYDGTYTAFGKEFISGEDFLFDKESNDPILKRIVFISYYAVRKGCCC